jgi:DNA-binding transcriptional MerR regulator
MGPMRLAELSSRSGISTATIKYYLRVGVLHPGEVQSSTWATYDASHLRRLALVRALTDVAGLPLEAVRRVLAAVDDDSRSLHETLGTAQWALSPTPETEPSPASLARVQALLDRHGWELEQDSPHRRTLAASLDTLDGLDLPATDDVLDAYATALGAVAQVEVERVAGEADRSGATEHAVIGTVLFEPVLLTIRRMAHEATSARR